MYISKAQCSLMYLSDFNSRTENGHFFGEYEVIDGAIIFRFNNEIEYKAFNGICKCGSISYKVKGLKGLRDEINDDYVHLLEA
ncbi:MAG: hypothetical protein ACRC3Y_10680 [Romboutsia sp.]|uniref:hypothetical protein n=1 Tax=Romboutsia sp. TaxID=1965302 RepID=UPI003F324495